MRPDNLLWVSVGRRPGLWSRLLWLSLGTAVGVAALVFFLALVSGLQTVILTHILGMVPDEVEVVPQTMAVGPLEVKTGGRLDPDTVDKLRKIPHVTAVYRRARLDIPSMLTAHYHGLPFVSDIIIEGVDEGLLQPELGDQFTMHPDGDPAPSVLAGALVEMLNAGLAVHVGGPALSRSALVGFHFDLVVGRSSFHEGNSQTFPCRVMAVSDHVTVSGPTLPMSYLEKWAQAMQGPPPDVYAAVLKLDQPDALQAVVSQVTSMGFKTPKQDQAARIATAARVVQAGLVCFCAVLLVVAGVGIANGLAMMVHEERTDIGLMRALGARRADVLWIFLVRALLSGLLGSVAGVVVGSSLVVITPHLASHWLPSLLGADSDWLHLTAPGVLGPVLFGTLASMAAGLLPARQAAALRPADALRGGE
ncbi:MAG TPA: FtsX-like permease family protein [Candidatus Xenobia bacterium]|jgi:ABC-type lipoprotein release transport system permease subunit